MNFIETVVTAAHYAPSADNSQPWHFVWDGEKLTLRYDTARVEGKTFPAESQATLLSIGAAIENILEISADYNKKASLAWLDRTFSGTHNYAEIFFRDPTEKENGPYLGSIQNISARHTNRFPFKKQAIPSRTKQSLSDMSGNNARLLISDSTDAKKNLWQQVKTAAEIRFQTQEVHEWLKASLRFTKDSVKNADGLDIRTLGLPPGGALSLKLISDWKRMKLLNKIGVHKLLAQIDSAPIKKAPAIVSIIGANSKEGAIEAGRLLVQCWNQLNAQGIAVHPYYVVADQLNRLHEGTIPNKLQTEAEQIETQCKKTLILGDGETLYMMLRIGYPKKANPPRSQRLPLEQVFTDLTQAK